MRTTYQRAFDHVTASDRLKKEVLEMTKQEKDILRRRIPRAVLIAAAIMLVLAGTAVAVSVPGIQDWFRQYWQETAGDAAMPAEQEEAIGQMTQPVGTSAGAKAPEAGRSPSAGEGQAPAAGDPALEAPAAGEPEQIGSNEPEPPPTATQEQPSAEAGGATVTLDSVTVGEDQIWLLLRVTGRTFEPGAWYRFAVTRMDGGPEKELSDLGIVMGGSFTYGRDWHKILDDGSLEILLLYQNADPNAILTDGRELTLCLANLMLDGELVLEGEWELPFTLKKQSPLPAIELEHTRLPVDGLDSVQEADFEKIRVTSAGMELICDAQYAGFSLWSDVALILTDGAEIGITGARGVWEGEAHESRWVADYTRKVPVALEQAATVRIGGQVLPLS